MMMTHCEKCRRYVTNKKAACVNVSLCAQITYVVVGILCRSSSWITGQLPMDEVKLDVYNATVESARIFCAVSSVSSYLIFFIVYTTAFCECIKFHRVIN